MKDDMIWYKLIIKRQSVLGILEGGEPVLVNQTENDKVCCEKRNKIEDIIKIIIFIEQIS